MKSVFRADTSDHLEAKLQRAAERACGAPALFEGFFPIVETFRGQTVGEGIVNLFTSDNGRVYAWAVEGDGEPQFVTVLQKPPVDSPLSAVRAWLVSQARKMKALVAAWSGSFSIPLWVIVMIAVPAVAAVVLFRTK